MSDSAGRTGHPSLGQRLMLAPACIPAPAPASVVGAVLRSPRGLCEQLIREGLAPLWCDWLAQADWAATLPGDFVARLKQERRAAAARYALQRRTAEGALAVLGEARVPSVLFKGAAVRERLYQDPAIRPAADLDLLVAPEARDRAVRSLAAAGFAFDGDPSVISHEASLSAAYASLDLHWGLMRPGRSRIDLALPVLATARTVGGLSVPSDDANLLVMLIHPAFSKHVNGRVSKLVLAADLDRMLRLAQPDWDWILSLIEAAGLRTAAWGTLYWQRLLLDTPIDPRVLARLRPGRLQRRYLGFWIERELPRRLGGIPGLVQGAFTLALHERPADVLRAVAGLLRAHLAAGRTLSHLSHLGTAVGSGRAGLTEPVAQNRRQP